MCKVAHCKSLPSGAGKKHSWATLCERHREAERRHGAPTQKAVLLSHLKPYLKRLDRRQKAQPNLTLWDMLDARWKTVTGHCEATLAIREAGKPGDRWAAKAAAEIVRVAEVAKARDVWRITIAMFLLRDEHPRQFVNDRAFKVQVGRRVRHLAPMNKGIWYDPATGKTKVAYTDPNQGVAVLVGEMLVEAFGLVGLRFAEQDREAVAAREAERSAFHAALKEAGEATKDAALPQGNKAGRPRCS